MAYIIISLGRRVIGFCYAEFTAPLDTRFDAELQNFPIDHLCFLGITAIMDPPRDDTAGAITACRQAGIKVFMVTGKKLFKNSSFL